MRHLLTFDVEDWFHLGIPNYPPREQWPTLPSIVEQRTNEFLRICEQTNARATFFVVGWVAARYPDLVPGILKAGHEVASHSYWHRRIDEVSPGEFENDVADSIAILASQGATVKGFRAPCFSVAPDEAWVYETLAAQGLSYSSSQLGGASRGGVQLGHGIVSKMAANHAVIYEMPLSRLALGPAAARIYVRFSGSGYLRVIPLPLVEAGLRREERAQRSGVVYLHPRDLAPDCPRIPMAPNQRFRKYMRLGGTAAKLIRLLERFEFVPCSELLPVSPRPLTTRPGDSAVVPDVSRSFAVSGDI